MKYQIKADLCPQCAAFLSEKFPRIEFRHLQYIRVCDSTKSFVTAGVWGSCRCPDNEVNVHYRIRFCVLLSRSDFPHPAAPQTSVGRPAGRPPPVISSSP